MSAAPLTPADADAIATYLLATAPTDHTFNSETAKRIHAALDAIASGAHVVLPAPSAETERTSITFIEQRDPYECERCCYAMLLGIDVDQVPHFCREFIDQKLTMDESYTRQQKWLAMFGYNRVCIPLVDGNELSMPDGWVIGEVDSPTGNEFGHAVIARMQSGKVSIIYDPSPLRAKSGKVCKNVAYLVPIGLPQARAAIPNAPAEGTASEQARFEAAMRGSPISAKLAKRADGSYFSRAMNGAWWAWQIRAGISTGEI